MPYPQQRTSIFDLFLKGYNAYLSYQEMQRRNEELQLHQQRTQQLGEESKAKLSEIEQFKKLGAPYLQPRTQTFETPGVAPTFTGEGPLGPRLSPDLALPPSSTTRTIEPSIRDKTIGAAFTAGKPEIVERLIKEPRQGLSEQSQMFARFRQEWDTANPGGTFDEMAKAWQAYQFNRGAATAAGAGSSTAGSAASSPAIQDFLSYFMSMFGS